MEVAYRLTRREQPALAEAFLLRSTRTDTLIRSLLGLGTTPLATVFRVSAGFLLLADATATVTVPGAIRLRRLAGDFFIPTDSDLSPALLPDELVGLTHAHGLIFLPGGEKLAFDPQRPLVIERCFQPIPVKERDWHSFPERPFRPDELRSLRGPEPTVGAVLEIGRPDGSKPLPGSGAGDPSKPPLVPEDARPPSSTFSERMKAGMKLRAGQFLNWLGRRTRLPGLSRAGADLAREALEKVPRLSEKVLGDQEAALREVLRQLREGDIEQGLRRAPIAVADPDASRPATIGTGSDLGSRDPRYSLRDLILSGGRATAWLGGGDVWNELAKEYRKLAEEAAKRGDFRRAAYLYGVLLRDLYNAANILKQGGLFRDAAILYRDRLKNLPLAAETFEAAGDIEEALRLRLQLQDYEEAGRLYRLLGQEAEAVEMYLRAAERLASQGKWARAGQLVHLQARDRALAVPFYRQGWLTPHAETVLCGQRLLEEYLDAQDWDQTEELLEQAEGMLRTRGKESGAFFNHALTLREFFPPAMGDDLKDRVRLHFAEQVRSESGSPTQARGRAEDLFGKKDHWSGPLLRDAVYAGMRHRPTDEREPANRPLIQVTTGTVRAVARGTFDLVVASDSEIVCWRPESGKLQPVSHFPSPRLGLATDAEAKYVYLLTTEEREGRNVLLKSFALRSANHFVIRPELVLGDGDGKAWSLAPAPLSMDGMALVPILSSERRTLFAIEGLTLDSQLDPRRGYLGVLFFAQWYDRPVSPGVWKVTTEEITLIRDFADPNRDLSTACPAFSVPDGSSLSAPPFDWLLPGPNLLEMVGWSGMLHWSRFEAKAHTIERVSAWSESDPLTEFVAACLVRPGVIAAVDRRNVLHWLRATNDRMRPITAPMALSLPSQVVYLVSRPHAREVVAVLEDGNVTRIDLP